MLLGDVDDGRVLPRKHFRNISRLAAGLSDCGTLNPTRMTASLNILGEYRDIIRDAGISHYHAVATAALRRASNRADFLVQARKQCSLEIEVVDGRREGELVAAGVLAGFEVKPNKCLIFDLGGASLEIIFLDAGKIIWVESYPLGVVGLAECGANSARRQDLIQSMFVRVRSDLSKSRIWKDVCSQSTLLIGTAGTASTLAALDLEMDKYDWRRINNHQISRSRLAEIHRILASVPISEAAALPGMEPGREDLIVPGVETVSALMDLCGKDVLTVSDFGLLEGLLLGLMNV